MERSLTNHQTNIRKSFSKKATFAVQCRLQNNNRFLVSWIPEEYAVKGRTLKLQDRSSKKWENGWIVLDTGNRMPYDFVISGALDHRGWREVTDI